MVFKTERKILEETTYKGILNADDCYSNFELHGLGCFHAFPLFQEVFHFSEETLYLSIHLLNRALRQIKVSTANLQLLGLVCLFLAAKKEECLLPEVL